MPAPEGIKTYIAAGFIALFSIAGIGAWLMGKLDQAGFIAYQMAVFGVIGPAALVFLRQAVGGGADAAKGALFQATAAKVAATEAKTAAGGAEDAAHGAKNASKMAANASAIVTEQLAGGFTVTADAIARPATTPAGAP